jgi:hypothetical protein
MTNEDKQGFLDVARLFARVNAEWCFEMANGRDVYMGPGFQETMVALSRAYHSGTIQRLVAVLEQPVLMPKQKPHGR